MSQSATGTHNRLQTDGTFNYLYDNEGNVTRKTRIAIGTYTDYTWDHRNRLTSVIDKSATGIVSKRTHYQYDAFDRRVLDRTGGTTLTRYDYTLYDGDHAILALRDSDGVGTAQGYRISNRYLHGNMIDQVFADEQYASGTGPVVSLSTASTLEGTTFWTLGDHLGSIRDVVDNAGVTRQHVVYDSFGKRLSEVDRNAAGTTISITNPAAIDTIFSYTGREWDKDTNLQNNRARWYDPATGRWLSQDPIGFAAGDANLYRYVGNGPTNATDPSGLEIVIGLRDLDAPPSPGAHQFLVVFPEDRNAFLDRFHRHPFFQGRWPLTTLCDPNHPAGGFTIAGHQVDGRLQVLLNQRADVRATQEGRHPGHDGFFGGFIGIMQTFSGDFSYQEHPVTPPNGTTELDFIGALLDAAEFYRSSEAANPIPYGATSTNCNRFMNSFLISVGLSGTHDFGDNGVTLPFGIQPFETAYDVQNATTLPPEYFPSSQNQQTQGGNTPRVPNAPNR